MPVFERSSPFDLPSIQPILTKRKRRFLWWTWEADTWLYVTVAPVTWDVGTDLASGGHRVTVPAGFVTDLASIPWWTQNPLFNPYGPEIVFGAIIHDWLTPTDAERVADPTRILWSPQVTVGVFYEVMRFSRVPRWKGRLFYWAVALGIKEW